MRVLKVHRWLWPSCWQNTVRDRAHWCASVSFPLGLEVLGIAGPCTWCSPAGLQTQPLVFQDYSLGCLESLLFLALPSLGCWGYSHSPSHSVLPLVNSEINPCLIQTTSNRPHLFTPQSDCCLSLLFCLVALILLQPSE